MHVTARSKHVMQLGYINEIVTIVIIQKVEQSFNASKTTA